MTTVGDPGLERHLAKHRAIVEQIYRENEAEHRRLSIIDGRPGERGHRYHGERCVWCGVNVYDEMLQHDQNQAAGPVVACGPGPDDWSENDWPLAELDALRFRHELR